MSIEFTIHVQQQNYVHSEIKSCAPRVWVLYIYSFFSMEQLSCVNDKIANKKIKTFHGIEKSFIYLFMLCAHCVTNFYLNAHVSWKVVKMD